VPEPSPPSQPLRTDDERAVVSMVKWLLYLVFVIVGWLTVSYLASLLSLVLVALGIAYMMSPVCDRLVARGVPRAIGALVLVLGFVTTFVGLIIVFAPRIAQQVASFVTDLPAMVDHLQQWLTAHGVDMPEDWRKYLAGDELQARLKDAVGPVQELATAALGGVFSLLGFVTEALLIPIFSFYFLLDWHHISERMKRIIPPRRRAHVVAILGEVDDVVAGWVRGQAIVTGLLALLYAIGFEIIGIRLAIPIGILVGVLTIIPFIGTFIGAAIVLTITLLDWQGAGTLIGVGVIFVMLHLLEAAILTPKITGQKVGLSESAALFAVVAGGKLLGFVGVLLAVPLAATVAVLLRHAVRAYEHSNFFGAESDADVHVPDAMKTILPDPAGLAAQLRRELPVEDDPGEPE
jgi:predicted PurR-regulated permease PerM